MKCLSQIRKYIFTQKFLLKQYLTTLWPLTLICALWPHEHMKSFHESRLVPLGLQTVQFYISSHLKTWLQMTFDLGFVNFDLLNKYSFPCFLSKQSVVPTRLFQSKQILQFYILQLDLRWAFDLSMVCDLWSMYDLSLIKIHQSIGKIWSNVTHFYT